MARSLGCGCGGLRAAYLRHWLAAHQLGPIRGRDPHRRGRRALQAAAHGGIPGPVRTARGGTVSRADAACGFDAALGTRGASVPRVSTVPGTGRRPPPRHRLPGTTSAWDRDTLCGMVRNQPTDVRREVTGRPGPSSPLRQRWERPWPAWRSRSRPQALHPLPLALPHPRRLRWRRNRNDRPTSAPPGRHTCRQPGGTDSLVQYHAHVLSLGQSAVRMALWSGGRAANPRACASAMATGPVVAPVTAHRGLWLCVELKGSPSRYGLINVTAVADAVTATATLLAIANIPVECQYAVTAVDLRCIEPSGIVMSHPRPLSPRALGITEGNTGGLPRVHEWSIQGPRPAAGLTGRDCDRVHRPSGSRAPVSAQPLDH